MHIATPSLFSFSFQLFFFNLFIIDIYAPLCYYIIVPREQRKIKWCCRESGRKEGFIMTTVETRWRDLLEITWGEALTTLDNIAEQGREEEAIEIIEEYFSQGRGKCYIPSFKELNIFIWFNLPVIMKMKSK